MNQSPAPPSISTMVTFSSQGTTTLLITRSIPFFAVSTSHVGGKRNDSFKVVCALNTFPAFCGRGSATNEGGDADKILLFFFPHRDRRNSIRSNDGQGWTPRSVQQGLGNVRRHWFDASNPRKFLHHVLSENFSALLRLFNAVVRNLNVQLRNENFAGLLVFQSVQNGTHSSERRRDDPRSRPTVDTVLENIDTKLKTI
jgi:hypothetical protein